MKTINRISTMVKQWGVAKEIKEEGQGSTSLFKGYFFRGHIHQPRTSSRLSHFSKVTIIKITFRPCVHQNNFSRGVHIKLSAAI